MSVTGILASSLFANAGAQAAQRLPLAANLSSGAQSAFAALQQKLSSSASGSGAGATSLSAQLTQVGQDLGAGDLSAAQNDFSTLKMTLAQDQTKLLRHFHIGSSSSGGGNAQTGSSGVSSQPGAGSDPLAAAMLAYGSLQQTLNSGALSTSLTPASTFAIDA